MSRILLGIALTTTAGALVAGQPAFKIFGGSVPFALVSSGGSGDDSDKAEHSDGGDSDRKGSSERSGRSSDSQRSSDSRSRSREAEPGDDHGGQGEVEAGDDHGRQGETEPGDDHGSDVNDGLFDDRVAAAVLPVVPK